MFKDFTTKHHQNDPSFGDNVNILFCFKFVLFSEGLVYTVNNIQPYSESFLTCQVKISYRNISMGSDESSPELETRRETEVLK